MLISRVVEDHGFNGPMMLQQDLHRELAIAACSMKMNMIIAPDVSSFCVLLLATT